MRKVRTDSTAVSPKRNKAVLKPRPSQKAALSGRLAKFCIMVLLCFCMSGGLSLSSLSLAFAQDVRPRTQSPATEPQTPGDSQLPGAAPAPEKKPAQDTEQTAAKEDDKEMKHHRGALVVAPLPIVSPAIGSGIIPVAGYIFPFQEKDKVSPPSVVGAAGLKLPLEQTGQLFFIEFLRNIRWKIFVGGRFITGNSVVTVRPTSSETPPVPPDIGLTTNLRALGMEIVRVPVPTVSIRSREALSTSLETSSPRASAANIRFSPTGLRSTNTGALATSRFWPTTALLRHGWPASLLWQLHLRGEQ